MGALLKACEQESPGESVQYKNLFTEVRKRHKRAHLNPLVPNWRCMASLLLLPSDPGEHKKKERSKRLDTTGEFFVFREDFYLANFS